MKSREESGKGDLKLFSGLQFTPLGVIASPPKLDIHTWTNYTASCAGYFLACCNMNDAG